MKSIGDLTAEAIRRNSITRVAEKQFPGFRGGVFGRIRYYGLEPWLAIGMVLILAICYFVPIVFHLSATTQPNGFHLQVLTAQATVGTLIVAFVFFVAQGVSRHQEADKGRVLLRAGNLILLVESQLLIVLFLLFASDNWFTLIPSVAMIGRDTVNVGGRASLRFCAYAAESSTRMPSLNTRPA